jgi:type I restriction enzyme, S subunit
MIDNFQTVEFFDIPNSWAVVDIETTIRDARIGIVRSAKEQFLDKGHPYIRMQHYDLEGNWNFNDITKVAATSEELKLYELKEGDVLFNTRNSYELVGKVAIWRLKESGYLYNNNLLRLRFFNGVLPKWIVYQMMSPLFRKQIELAKSATTNICAIYGKDLNRQPIFLSPLNEQRRLVAKIEALKTRSQRVKNALSSIPALSDQFRQSVLAAAFRGDLTADWRSSNPDVEPADVLLERTAKQLNKNYNEIENIDTTYRQSIPDTWTFSQLDFVLKNIQAGKNFTCPEIAVNENTVGLVKISAVTWGKFDATETKTVIDESKIDPKLFIKKGDFLISRANTIELVGACVVVENINHSIMISDKVWRVIFLEVESQYINYYLKSKQGRKEIESRATGNQLSMRNISQNAFKDIVIAFPPLEEQKEIVRQIQLLFKVADTIEQQYQQSKDAINQLDQSILAEAFRGALVPQDPNDEPASVLLERIRTEREKRADTYYKRSKKTKPLSEPMQMELELE